MRLVFIGDGDARCDLERIATEGVVFAGQRGKAEVLREMASAKGLVAPSTCC